MKFKISEKIFEKYPTLNVGVVIAKNIDNSKENDEIQEKIKDIIIEMRKKIDPEKVSKIPSIKKWREIYKSFGAKPYEYRNSAEALLKRILKKDLYKINSLVDIYNYISIKYSSTVGGEDINKIKGDLILDFANGDEEFIPLGEKQNQPPWKGEVVYKDNLGIICRCWNWREGDRTKLMKTTKKAILVIENLLPEEKNKLINGLEEMKLMIQRYCDAKCKTEILNKEKMEIEF